MIDKKLPVPTSPIPLVITQMGSAFAIDGALPDWHPDYAGPPAQTVLLGDGALRGGRFDWHAEASRTIGNDSAAQSLGRTDCHKERAV